MMPHMLLILGRVTDPDYLLLVLRTQPSLLTCLPRAIASAPGGTSSVIVEPAATYAPVPTRTGATSCESLPMNAPSSITVWCLARAVVVAGDRAGADVHLLADRRVAEVRQVVRLRALAERRSSSARRSCRRARPRRRRTAAGCGRTGRCARRSTTCDSTMTQKLLITTPSSIGAVDDPHAGVDLAAGADLRAPLEMDAGMDDRVGADGHVRPDVGRGRIDDRHAGRHQLVVLRRSENRRHVGQLLPAVHAEDLARVLER